MSRSTRPLVPPHENLDRRDGHVQRDHAADPTRTQAAPIGPLPRRDRSDHAAAPFRSATDPPSEHVHPPSLPNDHTGGLGVLVPDGFPMSSLKNDAERLVVQALCDQLTDSWLELPAIALSGDHRDYEIDVVVAHEREGIAIIEVKGHRPRSAN